MVYICPTCRKEFTEEVVAKHFLACWKRHNPNHKSVPAPCSEDIVTREIPDEVSNFFAAFSGKEG